MQSEKPIYSFVTIFPQKMKGNKRKLGGECKRSRENEKYGEICKQNHFELSHEF